MRFQLFIIAAFVFISSGPTFAARLIKAPTPQESSAKQKELDDFKFQRLVQKYKKSYAGHEKSYVALVERLYKNPNGTKFFDNTVRSLRSRYSQTTFYTPFSNKIIDELTRYAYIMDTSSEPSEVNDASRSYRILVNQHIANYEVLLHILNLSRADVKYGNPIFLTKIRNAIRKGLIVSDLFGGAPESAHHIYTYGEETYLLEQYGAIVESSEVYKVAGQYFNVHNMKMPDGKSRQVYMNVTAPILNTQILQEAMGLTK